MVEVPEDKEDTAIEAKKTAAQSKQNSQRRGTAISKRSIRRRPIRSAWALFRLSSRYRRVKNSKRRTDRRRQDVLAFGMLFGEVDETGNYSTMVKTTQNCEIIEVDMAIVEGLLYRDWAAIKDTATDDIPERVLVDTRVGNPPDNLSPR